MRTGYVISGIGHVGLILWLLFGGYLSEHSDAPPIQVADVSLITSGQLAQLSAAAAPPPAKPQTEVKSPKPAPRPDTKPEPKPEPKPKAEEPPKPQTGPKFVSAPPKAPKPPTGETPAPEPKLAPPPKVSQRIAPTPAPQPKPDEKQAPVAQAEVAPEKTAAPEKPQPPKEAAAPKEASTQIVPEAPKTATADTAPSAAPKVSLRPPPRPEPQVAAAEPPKPDTPKEPAKPEAPKKETKKAPAKPKQSTATAVDAALAAAMSATATDGADKANGPPLTDGEKNGLRLAIQQCWVVDPGSASALVTVTVDMSLTPDGHVVPGSVKLASSSGGDATAAKIAFESARRAVLRCGADGFKLPRDKYDQWRDIEMVFDPNGMRLR